MEIWAPQAKQMEGTGWVPPGSGTARRTVRRRFGGTRNHLGESQRRRRRESERYASYKKKQRRRRYQWHRTIQNASHGLGHRQKGRPKGGKEARFPDPYTLLRFPQKHHFIIIPRRDSLLCRKGQKS
eukprot:gene15265-biopygen6656